MSNFISLSQAAKEWNVSKGTISTAIKNGVLPTKGKNAQGGYKIDKGDFLVWYNNDYQNPKKTSSTEPNKTVQLNDNKPYQNSVLEAELKAEREMKNFYKEQTQKLEQERDDWKKQAQTLVLTYQPKEQKEEAVTTIKAELPAEPSKQTQKDEKDKTTKQNIVLKAIITILVVVLMVGAVAYNLGVINVSTGLKIENSTNAVEDTPQQ